MESELRCSLAKAAAVARPVFCDTRWLRDEIIDTFETDAAGRRHAVKELVEIESMQPINWDLPEDTQLLEMGCEGFENPVQRRRSMDRADFTERCVKIGGRLYALYEKRRPDIDIPAHLRPEVFKGQIEKFRRSCGIDEPVDMKIALRFAQVFRRLQLSREVVRKIIHGYVTDDLERTSGLKAASNEELLELAEVFEGIIDELPTLDDQAAEKEDGERLEDLRQYWYDVSSRLIERGQMGADPYMQMLFIERSARRDLLLPEKPADDVVIYTTPDVIDGGEDDHEDLPMDPDMEETVAMTDTSVFSAHPLHDETSAMSEEWLDMIHEADMKTLSEEKKWLMSSESWYLTKSQRAMAWDYIKARERRLIEETLVHRGDDVTRGVLRAILDSRRSDRQLAAMLFAWKNGESFEIGDSYLDFEERRPSEEELACAWQLLRRRNDYFRRAAA